MEFDLPTTAAVFVALIAVGVVGLIAAPVGMTLDTILMMVLPSMAVFGLLCLFVGMKYGQYRTRGV